jgi:hypothetical protein
MSGILKLFVEKFNTIPYSLGENDKMFEGKKEDYPFSRTNYMRKFPGFLNSILNFLMNVCFYERSYLYFGHSFSKNDNLDPNEKASCWILISHHNLEQIIGVLFKNVCEFFFIFIYYYLLLLVYFC